MKILEVISGFDTGGAERLLGNRLLEWKRQKHDYDVTVVYLKGDGRLAEQYSGCARMCRFPGVIRFARQFLSADVVHAHLLHAIILCSAFAIIFRKRIVWTLHNNYYRRDSRDRGIFVLLWLLSRLLPKGSVVVAISKCVGRFAVDVIGINQKMIRIIENGSPVLPYPPRVIARKRLGYPHDRRVAIMVGRLEPQKRPDWAIRALARLSCRGEWLLCFVGDGSLKEELMELTSELGLEAQVCFAGDVQNVQDYYSGADLLLLPSRFEGFGLVIVEALAAGLPVIASNLEGPAEILSFCGSGGRLFDAGNADEFVASWDEVASRLPDYILDETVRNEIINKYSIGRYSNDIHVAYRAMC